ncbi:MAG: U32 family peptidase [Spirochaetaceae bacterium]|jgi:putative protease|nr:U32 family peptidase [Spirochaetaceae bacterium]
MQSVELLAPAGSPEALDAAIGEGADGVYLGLKTFNARMRSANFTYPQFETALQRLHRMGRKVYVTVNTVFEQREADRLYQLLRYLAALGPDALIIQDLGLIRLVREYVPSLKLHASTQMNVASSRGVNLLSKYGLSRVVLARELSLEEIQDIRSHTNMELEVFVHGALCVSASGLCLFSSYLGGKSANRGMCTQGCRRSFRPGGPEEAPARGGYYFSPSDLQLFEQVPALAAAGVHAFKIEGRMKSADYVGAVVSAYRKLIDALSGNEAQIHEALTRGQAILRQDFAREKTTFYAFTPTQAGPAVPVAWLQADRNGGTGIPLGRILKVQGAGADRRALIQGGDPLPGLGDSVRFHRADDRDRESHKLRFMQEAPQQGPRMCWISLPPGFETGDAVYLIQRKELSKGYTPVIPSGRKGGRRQPGWEQAPELRLPKVSKVQRSLFPEGLYLAVSRLEDLYLLQASHPARVMLHYTRKTAAALLGPTPRLPFKSPEIILVLDPYFPQALSRLFEEEIPALMQAGYRQFVVNNLGHCPYFRGTQAALIAGPYLYSFNRWAQAFLSGLGLDYAVTPLENNRQNLERTVEPPRRPFTFITLFAYPALFRIRADLGATYAFRRFTDSRDASFTLINNREGSLLIPDQPLSLVDKLPFLEAAGFSRFILDLSGPPLKKGVYQDLMRGVKNAQPLAHTSRFNWKNGFSSPPAGLKSLTGRDSEGLRVRPLEPNPIPGNKVTL